MNSVLIYWWRGCVVWVATTNVKFVQNMTFLIDTFLATLDLCYTKKLIYIYIYLYIYEDERYLFFYNDVDILFAFCAVAIKVTIGP